MTTFFFQILALIVHTMLQKDVRPCWNGDQVNVFILFYILLYMDDVQLND